MKKLGASGVLADLRGRGVRLRAEDGKIRYDAPAGVVTPADVALLREHKADLLELLAREELRPRAKGVPVPASFAQEGLWVFQQLSPGKATYNKPIRMRLVGRFHVDALERSLREIARRHEVFRTTFAEGEDGLEQVVADELTLRVEQVEAVGATREERETFARAVVDRAVMVPFDLAKGPMLRATLVSVDPDVHLLAIATHHIAMDGWSLGLFQKELTTLYEAFAAGRPSPLPEIPVQYGDFAIWQRAKLEDGGGLDGQVAYWREHLRGAPTSLELPTDRPRPAVKRYVGSNVKLSVPDAVVERSRELALAERATLFMVTLAAYGLVLGRWSGQNDFVLGTAISGRPHVALEPLIGMFVNTLALRVSLDGVTTFRELLARTRETVIGAYAHQDVPFERVVAEVNPAREASRTPLVQVVLSLQMPREGEGATAPRLGEAEIVPDGDWQEVARFDVNLSLIEEGKRLRGFIEYETDLFDRSTMERMAEHFVTLLDHATQRPDEPLHRLPLMSEAERRRVLHEWNPTEVAREDSLPLHRRFEAHVDRAPEAVALLFDGKSVTYGELDRRANQLAHRLRALGVGPETIVGMRLERSIEMIVAVLGILKAGGAYLPLDPIYPADRAAFMVADAGADVLVSTRGLERGVGAPQVVFMEEIDREPTTRPTVSVRPSNLIYVIFTSGSTGQPKGALLTHHNVSRLFDTTEPLFGFGPNDTWTLFHSIAFDFSVWELWGALAYGGRLVVVPQHVSRSTKDFVDLVVRCGVTVLNQTPSAFRVFMEEALAEGVETKLRYVVFGGEALDIPSLAPWFARYGDAQPTLVNMYGITETTVHVTYRPIRVADTLNASSVIGGALPDLRLYVLDAHGEPLPPGVAGEMYVGGAGLARGYLGRAALTATRFVPDPFSGEPGARLYRSGDLARWKADGSLEYLGRIDHQVKIRGFRIELGEIESALAAYEGVARALVFAREDIPGDKRLVAYVVPQPGATISAASVRESLARTLPEYMVPSAIVTIDDVPLTSNGKVDRKALPAPGAAAVAKAEHVAPRTPLEQTIARAWEEVLGVPGVGIHDNYFAIGGHSLNATRVIARLRTELGVELPLQSIFELPTIAGLAAAIEGGLGAKSTDAIAASLVEPLPVADRSKPLRATSAQARLWFIEQFSPGNVAYNVAVSFAIDGPLDTAAMDRAFGALVERHDAMRTTFVAIEGEPHQIIHPSLDVRMAHAEARSEDEASEIVSREMHAPFDLVAGPLVRATLVSVRPDRHIVAVVTHHIVSDGWSVDVAIRELLALYEAFAAGKPSPLPPLPCGYAEYTLWQNARLSGSALERQLAFWKQHLDGAPTALELPTDRPRPAVKQYAGGSLRFRLTPAQSARVDALCAEAGVTPFMFFLAAFQCVLSRWSGQEDVVVGTPVANRTRPEFENLIGFFVNTLPIRTRCPRRMTFRELLGNVKVKTLEALTHQDAPFETLVELLQVPRDPSRTPVFQAMFAMQNFGGSGAATESVGEAKLGATGGSAPEFKASKFDLTLSMFRRPAEYSGALSYDSVLFDASTVARLIEHFRVLIDGATHTPDTALGVLPLMTDEEKRRVLLEWNATAKAAPPEPTADSFFAARAAETPDAVAVELEGSRLSYRELDDYANRVASWLVERGVARESRVAVEVTRSEKMLAALLGVMRAGAVYVPIDPAYPDERRAYMRENAGVRVELTDATLAEALSRQASPVRRAAVQASDLAYVLHTSGSTGKPKGVMVPHGALVNFLQSMAREPGLTASDTLLAVTTLSFDIAGLELYLPLVVGAKVVIASRDTAMDPSALAALLAECKATVMQATPATWSMMLASGWQPPASLRVFCGGEAVSSELANALAKDCGALWNVYGPTETTIWSTCTRLAVGQRVTIGHPIDNTQVYVVDEMMNATPIGVPGELCIAGAGLARGYERRPDLTAERFVPDPFGAPGARMYRTGDLARWLPSGEIECLGRIDHQVKVRGFRIELGEIEAALVSCAGVAAAAATVHEGKTGEKLLVGYVVARPEATLDVESVRTELRKTLPEYMVPSAILSLTELPLTPNGKVDRKALPAPDARAMMRAEYVAPRTPLEETIAEIWQGLLGLPRVGIHDDFFNIGGHSLLVMKMLGRIREALDREVSVRTVFNAPTVAGLARRLSESGDAEPPPITPTELGGGDVLSYIQDIFVAFERDRKPSGTWTTPVRLRLRGPLDVAALQTAIRELVARQEALRLKVDIGDPTASSGLCSPDDIALNVVDMRGKTPEEIRGFADQRTRQAFERAPFVWFDLLQITAEEHLLLITWHQLVHDPTAPELLFDELRELYFATVAGRSPELPPLPLRYVDFAAWQKRWYEQDAGKKEIEIARKRLEGMRGVELPTDRPRKGPVSPACLTVPIRIDTEASRRFLALCEGSAATAFMGFGAVTAIFMALWSGQEEVTFLSPVNLRELVPEMQHVIGRFLNLTVISMSLAGDPTVPEVLKRARVATLAAYEHSMVPAQLVFGTPLIYDHPLLRVLLNTPEVNNRPAPVRTLSAPPREERAELAISTEGAPMPSGARNDVAIVLALTGDHIYGGLRGATDLFDPATIKRKAEQLTAMLKALDHDVRLSDLRRRLA